MDIENYNKKKFCAWITVFALMISIGIVWILVQPARTMSGEIICGIKEHTHTEDCYEYKLVCNLEEDENHVHNETCQTTELVCSQEEHTHSEKCYEVKEAENSPLTKLSATQKTVLEQLRREIPGNYTEVRTAQFKEEGIVYLFSQPDAIPKEVELKVELLDDSSELFAEAEQRVKEEAVVYDNLEALDISLIDETGKEIEPTAPVYVSIDFGNLLSEEVDPKSIQIQHHKEIEPSKEEILDVEKSVLTQNTNTQSYIATFPTESFSIYTITSSGWPNLKIRIECVDEYGQELIADDKPADIMWTEQYKPNASFSKMFMSDEHDAISGYKYDGKAFLMINGKYDRQIYGIRRENNKWYYYTKDKDRNLKVEFPTQPNFLMEGESDPSDFIRVVYRKVTDINVKYMDDAGIFGENEIPLSAADSPNGRNPDVIEYVGTELEIGNIEGMPKSNTYFFCGKAYVGAPTYDNQVVKVIRSDRKPYGVTLEGKKILITEEEPLKLMYRKIKTENPEKVTAVPTRDKGMKINLFNYNASINRNHNLQFLPEGSKEKAYNNWTGKDGGIFKGIVGDTLVEGYPTVEGESLDYLFDPAKCREQLSTGQVKSVHTNLDSLFLLDKDGYYHYDSMANFATVIPENGTGGENVKDSDGGDFLVYEQPALPGYKGTGDNAKFLPFDTYANANKPKENNKPTNKEFHFGMTMEAMFTIPPGGMVADADGGHTGLRDMIFEFNGDDDVWIFIDNKLVLDLGGIHDRYGGRINFRTGEVITNAPPTPNSGRYQKNLYNIEGDPNQMTDDELKKAREAAGFGKFSQHHFKFFYLERGKGASNCEIRFNLVPVEHELIVGKRTPEKEGASTEHMWYQFQAETEFKGVRKPLAYATYQRISWKPGADPITGGQLLDAGMTDEKGRFWLRAGERADFSGAIDLKHSGATEEEKIDIYVSEILQDGTVTPKVTAWSGSEEKPNTCMEIKDEVSGKIRKLVPPLYDYKDNNLAVELHTEKTKTNVEIVNLPDTDERAYQVAVDTGIFNEFNWIDFENDVGNLAGLNIIKNAKNGKGNPILGVPFAIKVELWNNKDQTWNPLPEGAEYWILNDRVIKPGETLPESDKLHLKKSDNGLISIQHGQSIHLHVLPGTKYRVSEVLNMEDKVVYTTTYEGKSSIRGETFLNETGQEIENKTGIKAGSQHYITINNTGDPVVMPNGSFVLMKKTEGVVPPNTAFQFRFRIQDYTNSEGKLSVHATYYGAPTVTRAQGREETIVLKPGTDGSYEGTLSLYPGEIVVIQDLPEGKALQVQEVFEAAQDEHYEVRFWEKGKDTIINDKMMVTSPIDPKQVVQVICENRSNLKEEGTLLISKEVKRTDQQDGGPLPEDKERSFPFKVTIQKPGAVSLKDIPVKKMFADGKVSYSKLNFEPNGEDYVAELELKHGESIVMRKLPVGIQVLVEEVEHKGYAVSMNGTSGNHITVDLGFNTGVPYEVKCVNMTGVRLPETGGHGITPFFLLGTIMILSAIGGYLISFYRKRV